MSTSSNAADSQENGQKPALAEGEKDAMASLAEAFKQAGAMAAEDHSTEGQLEALEAKIAEYHDAALRGAAELENTRKRAEREKQEASKYAISGFARDLVSVYENLSRASGSIPLESRATDTHLNTLATGVDMTLGELARVFEKHQIQRIDPAGQPFDHNFHQAMMKIETADYPEGTVVQVMQAAYVMHDRLLQPAFVGVATAPSASTAAAGGASHHVDTKA